MISIFDIYKIGIGPSSSHTVGPMKAGKYFVDDLEKNNLLYKTTRIKVFVYGSLSLTGIGHATDTATIMGLAGYMPDNVDIDQIPYFIHKVKTKGKLPIAKNKHIVDFVWQEDMIFNNQNLPLHENGMTIKAYNNKEIIWQNTYYSIGGGFIVDEEHFNQSEEPIVKEKYSYFCGEDLLNHCKNNNLTLDELALENELSIYTKEQVLEHVRAIWKVMRAGIDRGLSLEGILPGPYKVKRRAHEVFEHLKNSKSNDPLEVIDWINAFALAVNEENAIGGRVVTAPTNGSCGIIPAVLAYYEKFVGELTDEICLKYFLTSSIIASLYKLNASFSGAEVGCQGEVGVACSMAAAGLASIMGATVEQVFIAAEIGMEHNLGLTCDPLNGQVQVPCIERNAVASVKAVNAARMALMRKDYSEVIVSLDEVISTMYETGKDMLQKYRETSQGGLAIKVTPRLDKALPPCA